jgi:DNA-directed RNA polymerase subunit RPC12/RpoP
MPDDIPIATPIPEATVIKPPTVTKAVPTGRQFPCLQCAARLDFDPSIRGMKCPYCGYEKSIDKKVEAEILEHDYLDYLSREEGKGSAIPGRSSEVRCTGCGANVLLEDKIETEKCPYCLTHLTNEPQIATQMIQPESVLPFELDLRGSRTSFSQWLGSLWFAPSGLVKLSALGQLTGIYVPFWTYDSETFSKYSGQRGDNYTTYETFTERMSDGSTRQVSRPVTRINWSWVQGEVDHFFDDVLVCGSKSVRPDLLRAIQDWKLRKLETFQPEYLSGFRTERYSIGLKDGYLVAKDLMEPTIVQMIRQDIGGDHQRIDDKTTRYSAITFKHTLLPVWLAVYRFHGKTFQIVINGRTGAVAGDRPYSIWKITSLVLAIIAVIVVIALLVMKFQ